jgi:multicomponent Na+:H+ antiporter subunit D
LTQSASWLVVSPVLWPLMVAALLLGLWRHGVWQRWISVGASGVHLLLAGSLCWTVQTQGTRLAIIGNWPPPFGINFVADRLGALMTLMAALVGMAVAIYSVSGIDRRRESFGYHTLVQVLLAGVCGAFLTGDFFNLFVWFEVMLMASFVLLSLGGERRQMEGALQYVSLNLLASTVFLIAIGLIYGLTGSLNMADVAMRLPASNQPAVAATACALLVIAFGIKAAIFPVYVWLPASYHTPPTVVTALFAGLLTKVGVYALMRGSVLLFEPTAPFLIPLLMILGILTMVFGVLGPVAQSDFRKVLSFHIVSQIGYMIIGIGMFTPAALAAAVYYMVHNIFVKTGLLMIGGIARRYCHSEDLKKMGGLYKDHPLLAGLFLVSALSLAGLPPFSGFWGKLFLVHAGIEGQHYGAVAAALAVSVFTLFSMLKLWNEALWKAAPECANEPERQGGRLRWRYMAAGFLVALSLVVGIGVGTVYPVFESIGTELLDRNLYINAVLGGGNP